MMEEAPRYPNRLKYEIKRRGYKLCEVAKAVYISERALWNYCAGRRKIPSETLEALSKLLECPISDLAGYPEATPPALSKSSSGKERAFPSPAANTQDIIEEASEETEGEDMNSLRRRILQTFGIAGIGIVFPPLGLPFTEPSSSISEISVNSLAAITQQFRVMQRQGNTFIIKGLDCHIATIQDALKSTTDDKIRRELWHILAQTQIVARLNPIKKLGKAQAKTLNEAAIASAINSGDTILTGAAIGHLAHLYLREDHDLNKASQLLEQAREYTREHQSLNGWLAIVKASIAARQGDVQVCEALIAEAMEVAHQIPQARQGADPYFTDFSNISVHMFAGHCWLTAGKPKKAHELLTTSNIEELSVNRHASAYYDITRAYIAAGDLEAAQSYVFKAMDIAHATGNDYIILRCSALAHTIQQKYHCEWLSRAIIEYAQNTLAG
jgi:transcriptional regulator with XRE-family HTH domain